VYGDTLKIASGLGHTAKQQNSDETRDEGSADNEEDNQVLLLVLSLT